MPQPGHRVRPRQGLYLITFLRTPGTQAEGEGLGACRAMAWVVGLSPRASPPPTRAIQNSRGHSSCGPQDRACCQGSTIPAECPVYCPAAHQPRTSHPSCPLPLLPALPHLPSKATGETPVPLSSQHKGHPHDPPQASPDTQQEQAPSMWPMGAPAHVAAGTATAGLSTHTPATQALCPGPLCPSKG